MAFAHVPAMARAGAAGPTGPRALLCVMGGFTGTKGAANLHDLWCLPESAQGVQEWTNVSDLQSVRAALAPGPRGYAAMAAVGGGLVLVGGARCSPGCTCFNDVWQLQLRTAQPLQVAW